MQQRFSQRFFGPFQAVLGALGLLGSAFACAPPHPASLYSFEAQLAPKDYPIVLRTWTQSAKIYQGLDDKMFVTATYHAPELRRAFALAFPDIYGHGGKITRRELVDLTGGVEQHHNFLLAVYTPNNRWNDLGRDDSIWRLALRGSNDIEVGPDEIIPIKVDENLRAVYPYITRFDKVYLVRFPLIDPLQHVVLDNTTTDIRLRIASALGSANMRWHLTQTKAPMPASLQQEDKTLVPKSSTDSIPALLP